MIMRTAILCVCLFAVTGCYQKMAQHAGYKPLTKSEFFTDERSSRPVIENAIARGQLRLDRALYEGRDANGNYVEEFPYEMTEFVLKRGEQRYNVFCSMCHGMTGHGDGRIVKRGYLVPPDYSKDLSRGIKQRYPEDKTKWKKLTEVPVGYIYEVITKGYGAMGDHAEQIPVRDRWAIVGYVKALQAFAEKQQVAGGTK
jgi:mono/diheme cytochrome c family protein